jgi:hypothetical protein
VRFLVGSTDRMGSLDFYRAGMQMGDWVIVFGSIVGDSLTLPGYP